MTMPRFSTTLFQAGLGIGLLCATPAQAQRIMVDPARVLEQALVLAAEKQKLDQLEAVEAATRKILQQQQNLRENVGTRVATRIRLTPLAPAARATSTRLSPRLNESTQTESAHSNYLNASDHWRTAISVLRARADQLSDDGQSLTLTQLNQLRQQIEVQTNQVRLAAAAHEADAARAKILLQSQAAMERAKAAERIRNRQILKANFSP